MRFFALSLFSPGLIQSFFHFSFFGPGKPHLRRRLLAHLLLPPPSGDVLRLLSHTARRRAAVEGDQAAGDVARPKWPPLRQLHALIEHQSPQPPPSPQPQQQQHYLCCYCSCSFCSTQQQKPDRFKRQWKRPSPRST